MVLGEGPTVRTRKYGNVTILVNFEGINIETSSVFVGQKK